jgi:superfamily I DNA and RNA helicase
MQILPSRAQFLNNPAASALLATLESQEEPLALGDAILYRSFPLYRDEEGGVIVADSVLVSRVYGVVTLALSSAAHELADEELERCLEIVEQVPSYVQSRLIKNRQLRHGPTNLAFEITPVIYAPLLGEPPVGNEAEGSAIIQTAAALYDFLETLRERVSIMSLEVFKELVATLEGAKGLIRPKKRPRVTQDDSSKGRQADLVEGAITLFDQQQKHGIMGQVTGPQRIRGLAGSGKTVVLAMKAAQAYLQNSDANIVYTFSTKSLYQHVKRLITRFYRQFDDRDPDWDRHLHVMHGWGSHSMPGIYAMACEHHGVEPLSFQEASAFTIGDRFDYACTSLLESAKIEPMYDYVFVDEGQDFPLSFIRLCHALSREGHFVLAYDDLQTIFQATTPSTAEIFGSDTAGNPKATFQEDVVLHRCYRNPREVLVTAHALGFGLYGEKIVQMLESAEHWEDIGYVVREGTFVSGSRITIERPKENSLTIISDRSGYDEIIQSHSFEDLRQEVDFVSGGIESDISDGLQADDILVVSVDDRHAKRYLSQIEEALQKKGIPSNNLHSDSFGIRDFTKEGRVTLATVHKAKGNEALMVYVVGVDSVMFRPDVRKRNMLFTAMTRAKGWVRVSGVGSGAARCQQEIEKAKEHFPNLVFEYPGPEQLKIMKRDLASIADKRLRARRLVEQLQQEFSDDEINALLNETKAGPRTRKRSRKNAPR